jgi:hypothetical protein
MGRYFSKETGYAESERGDEPGCATRVSYHKQRVLGSFKGSFPLNRRGWFARDVVDHAVNPAYFVDDTVGYLG